MLFLAPLGYFHPLAPTPHAAARRHQSSRAIVESAALVGAAGAIVESAALVGAAVPWWDVSVPTPFVVATAALLGAAVTRRGAPADEDAFQYGIDVPYKEAAYDPVAADAFFRKRPVATARRLLQLTRLSGQQTFCEKGVL